MVPTTTMPAHRDANPPGARQSGGTLLSTSGLSGIGATNTRAPNTKGPDTKAPQPATHPTTSHTPRTPTQAH